MGVPSRLGAAFLILLAAAAFVALAGVGAAGAATDPPSEGLVAGADERVLRLHDLPPGYRVADDSGCHLITSDDSFPTLTRFLRRNPTAACDYEYERFFAAPGIEPSPPFVRAETLALRDEAAAAELLALVLAEIRREGDKAHRREMSPPPIGAETTFFRERERVEARSLPASALVWREGRFLAAITSAGLSPAANDAAALRLAARQQERILAPTPYTEAERDDLEVVLDDPKLEVPVYWLGRSFQPGPRMPTLELTGAGTEIDGFVSPAHAPLEMAYNDEVSLRIWPSKTWKQLRRDSRLFFSSARCRRLLRTVPVPSGRALVYETGLGRGRSCSGAQFSSAAAIVHTRDAVVGIKPTLFCGKCGGTGEGRYDTIGGIESIARGLLLRPKPVF